MTALEIVCAVGAAVALVIMIRLAVEARRQFERLGADE